MNLAEMLGYADIAQLSRIAVTYRCDCNGHSKHELIQSILAAVGRREQLDAQIDSLTIEDLRFLHSLLFDARDAFSLEELIARVQASRFDAGSRAADTPVAAIAPEPASEAAPGKRKRKAASAKAEPPKPASTPGPRDTIARFKHYGWLFNGISGTNRYLFHVPSDLKARFREALTRRFEAALEYGGEPRVFRDEQEHEHECLHEAKLGQACKTVCGKAEEQETKRHDLRSQSRTLSHLVRAGRAGQRWGTG